MRESIGATSIFALCLTFIMLFTAYLAISVNYAKAFKVKNYIVSDIEENKTIDAKKLETYLTAQGYSASGNCEDIMKNDKGSNTGFDNYEWLGKSRGGCLNEKSDGNCGACIYSKSLELEDKYRLLNTDIRVGSAAYYKVVVFFKFDIPIVSTLLNFNLAGDTEVVYVED